MRYQFKYKFPLYMRFNLFLYPIIVSLSFWLLFIPTHETTSISKAITVKIVIAILGLYFLYISYLLIKTLRESKYYSSIIVDDESITFPFKENGENITWKFKEIDSIRFDYYKTSFNIRRHYFIELNKGLESQELYRSWMNHFAYLKLQVVLRKQGILLEKPI